MLNIDSAIPCGLILNELLTNCYKHAFKDKTDGQIDVIISNHNNNFKMIVKDNGNGLPEDYNQKQSLGITVVDSLAEQLDAKSIFLNDNGTEFQLMFKTQ